MFVRLAHNLVDIAVSVLLLRDGESKKECMNDRVRQYDIMHHALSIILLSAHGRCAERETGSQEDSTERERESRET